MRQTVIILSVICVFIVACSKDAGMSSAAPSASGQGGSLARFTIIGNYLYLADDHNLVTYNITSGSAPVETSRMMVGFGIETIYPYNDNLFIGSRDGMFIYSVKDPRKPTLLGTARHVRSCDPVVANDSIAFVTLRGGSPCGATQDGLYVYNIKNVMSPTQIKLMPLSKPGGLGLKDTTLFVCREDSGMAIINVKNPAAPYQVKNLRDGIYYDVIALDNILVCMVKTGILLYDVKDVNNIKLINSISN